MGPRHISAGIPTFAVTRWSRTCRTTKGRSRHLFMLEKKIRENFRTHHIFKFSEAAAVPVQQSTRHCLGAISVANTKEMFAR